MAQLFETLGYKPEGRELISYSTILFFIEAIPPAAL